ncbi:hypothetical protein BBK36DRAFT_1198532 [Trichoderma citrinoviride]|uniref:Integral membrane protein n=1 Tax=Trichoderma citrinoviride TaxID=58853 RepID=A0A2T4BBV9_9HYPO|nr:hypothetical protein BBK36DRAFT_1198532 [Trichoderma citrinoviride]PTB66823.1 hypothetical protein BBK36DRAFT_1198532 [Trichoderma citrinoviride]
MTYGALGAKGRNTCLKDLHIDGRRRFDTEGSPYTCSRLVQCILSRASRLLLLLLTPPPSDPPQAAFPADAPPHGLNTGFHRPSLAPDGARLSARGLCQLETEAQPGRHSQYGQAPSAGASTDPRDPSHYYGLTLVLAIPRPRLAAKTPNSRPSPGPSASDFLSLLCRFVFPFARPTRAVSATAAVSLILRDGSSSYIFFDSSSRLCAFIARSTTSQWVIISLPALPLPSGPSNKPAAAQAPITTLVPFADRAQLPACAAACGHLYDANGACVPPAIPTNTPAAYTSCFCFDPRLAPFSTTTAGVCDNACTGDPNGLASITNWYHSVCNVKNVAAPTTTSTTTTTTGNPSAPQRTDQAPSGDWISNHWQWVVMLVILVVGIAGIWIGACIWRRRYLRNRELRRQAGGGNTNSWGSGVPAAEAGAGIPMTYQDKAHAAAALPNFTSTSEKRGTTTRAKLWPFSSS